jgi:hypothetical protein
MGFGSYDESEQENHDGSVEFEIGASNDELLDRLEDIKGN